MLEPIYQLIKNTDSGSAAKTIFIVGKGPSIDELEGIRLPTGLVINLNDSEKIIQGHVGIFSGNWVRHSLKDRGFKCKYYLAGKPLPSDVPHAVLPPLPLEYDDDDLIMYRLGVDDFYDESFVLLNALKLCVRIGRQTGVVPEVYLLGFDFTTSRGEISRHVGVDFAKGQEGGRELAVHSQEHSYLQFARFFREHPLIRLTHVGDREFSQLSTAQFKARFGVARGGDATPAERPDSDRVLVVAELTNNHLGDTERLLEMVERAREAGADLIKIQKRDVDSFYSEEKLNSYYWSPFGKTLGDYRRGVELNEEKLQLLDDACKRAGIEWFCSVLDFESFRVIRKFSPRLVKIPSTISNHREFHSQIAEAYQGEIVISTGYTDQSYEEYVLKTFARNQKVYLLHCISAYPTAMADCNVAVVGHYAELATKHPRIVPGYSSHDLGSLASVLAVASGARMLEKHVKLGDVEWVHFDKVALDLKTNSFRDYVRDVREAEKAIGSPVKRVLPSEHHKYEVNRK